MPGSERYDSASGYKSSRRDVKATKKLKEVSDEYKSYKERASSALQHKDEAIKRALEGASNAGRWGSRGGHGGGRRGGAGMVLPRNATTEYLKNVVIQYMASDEAEVREHMEGAIATVLQFTDTDIAFAQ